MIKRDTLIDFIINAIGTDTINQARQMDELANGVQFSGGDKVETVTLGVSLNSEFLKQAARIGSNFAIFHHALDPRVYKGLYPQYTQKRLKLIFQHNFTILGFHAALDIHPILGNNAQIAKKLGTKITDSLYEGWGFTARFPKPISTSNLKKKCQKLFGPHITSFLAGPNQIKTIGICSGAAKPYAQHIHEMQTKGIQAYISGETSESTPYKMLESDINYFVCGHYATEVFGVQALGKAISRQFGDKLKVEFIDVPNPI